MEPRWTSAAKDTVGTAYAASSRAWYTVSHGILNEIYAPRIDEAVTRDVGFLVGGPDGFVAEIKRHADEAITRWPLQGLTIIHRFGRIAPGENIVLVVTASSHREAAFHAAEFLMDYLKTNAPFWKQEEGARGASWIEAREHDDTAAARWTKS